MCNTHTHSHTDTRTQARPGQSDCTFSSTRTQRTPFTVTQRVTTFERELRREQSGFGFVAHRAREPFLLFSRFLSTACQAHNSSSSSDRQQIGFPRNAKEKLQKHSERNEKRNINQGNFRVNVWVSECGWAVAGATGCGYSLSYGVRRAMCDCFDFGFSPRLLLLLLLPFFLSFLCQL